MSAFYSFLLVSMIILSGEVRAHNGSCRELVNFLKPRPGVTSVDEYNDLVSRIAGNDETKQKKLKEYINTLAEKTPQEMAADCRENLTRALNSWVKTIVTSTKEDEKEAQVETRESCEAVEALLPNEELNKKSVRSVPFRRGLCTESPLPFCHGMGPILNPEIEKIADFHLKGKIGPVDEPYSPSDCECFDEALKDRNQNKENIVNKSGPTYAKIDGLILEATGKKIVNEFAAFYEDVRYYKESSGWALDTSKDGIESSVLCSESKDFQAAIKNKCGDTLSEGDQEARTSAILGVYGNKFKANSAEFPNSLKNLLSDFESPDNSYSRTEFDKVRFGVNNIQADVSLANKIVTSLIKNKDMNSKLNKLMSEGKSPLEAIKQTLAETNKSDPKLLKKMLKDLEDPKVAELNDTLIGVLGHEGLNEKANIIFGRALAFNPGFKSLLLDSTHFKTVSAKINKGDFMTFAEKHGVLKSQFKERCSVIQNKLAEAVCTNPSELKSKIDRKDLVTILENNKLLATPHDGIDMAICATNKNVVDPKSVFAKLDLESIDPIQMSDYHDIKNHPSHDQNSMYSRAAKNPNDPAFLRVAKAYDYQRVPTVAKSSSAASSKTGSGSDSFAMINMKDIDSLMKSQHFASAQTENVKAPKVAEETRQGPNAVEAALGKVSNDFQATEANKSASAVNGMGVPFQSTKAAAVSEQSTKAPEMKPFQSELVKELSSGEPEKVNKLVKNINESDAKELLQLREQVRSNKSVMSGQNLEAEKARMAELKTEYEELEKKLETLKKEKSSLSDRPQMAGESFSAANKFVSAPNFQENSNVAYEPRATGGGLDGFSSQAEEMSSQAKSANMRNVANLSASAAPIRDIDSKGDNKLMVISSQKSGSGPDDPSGELINFLAKNETDSEALRSLKESGLLYKVEVNENGKKEVKTKLIKYNELTPEAKLIVDRRLSHLEITESQTLTELEKKVLLSKRAYSIQALRLELLSVSRQ